MTSADSPAAPPSAALTPTARTQLARHPDRARYERAALHAILDEALVCHVAVSTSSGPKVLPTAHVRVGEQLYLHGARENGLLTAIARGAQVCLAVTLLDGLVFSRRAFNHSMNYRSVVLYGVGREVTSAGEKRQALEALVEHMAPGRSAQTEPATEAELQATLVVAVPIAEGSAKVRSGPPLDNAAMHDAPHWAGELPLRLQALPARSDPSLRAHVGPSLAVEARALSLGASTAAIFERRRGALCVSTDPALLDFAFVHEFLARDSYWAREVPAEQLALAMRNSLCFGLYNEERQIGFARVVSDFARFAYLADVFVASHARGRGHGSWLVEQVLAHPSLAKVRLTLLGTADAHRLYERVGFEVAPSGLFMRRLR